MTDLPDPRGGVCYWCGGSCGGSCLGLTRSTQMTSDDPAYWMLSSGHVSTSEVYKAGCYICEDPEFAQMGLPLCKPCLECKVGHVAADDTICDDCGADQYELWCLENEDSS